MILICLSFVSAATTINRPITSGNYTTAFIVNVTTALPNALNVTIYYNASGGAVGTANSLVVILNDSASDTAFYNGSVSLLGLSDGTYNFTAVARNSSTSESSTGVSLIKIDNTFPVANSDSFVYPLSYGNYSDALSGLVIFNVTLSDATSGINAVLFNLTNSSGSQAAIYNTTMFGSYWNASANVSALTDDVYTLTIFVNDSAGNLNNSATRIIRVDNDAPTVAFTRLSTSSENYLNISIAISGAESGVNGSCTVNVARAVISGSGNAQVLSQENLDCGTTYIYNATCRTYTDLAASDYEAFVTDACTTGGSSSSSSSVLSSTYSATSSELKNGYSNQLKAKDKIKFSLDSVSHVLEVKTLSSDKVTIQISSDPVQVSLGIGEEGKVDLDSDGTYDLSVKLSSIASSKASVVIKEISESVPEGSSGVEVSGVDNTNVDGDSNADVEESKSNTKYYIIIIVIVLVVVAFVLMRNPKKK